MTYLKEVEELGRKRTRIELHRFAADLCAAMGGTDLNVGDYEDTATFELGTDRLLLRAVHHKSKVQLDIVAADVPHKDRKYDLKHKTESVNVNPDRPICYLARDIMRRLVDASQPALGLQRAYARGQAEARHGVAYHAKRLLAAYPKVRVTINETSATVSSMEPYVQGRMDSEGRVAIDRTQAIPLEKFIRVLDVLGDK